MQEDSHNLLRLSKEPALEDGVIGPAIAKDAKLRLWSASSQREKHEFTIARYEFERKSIRLRDSCRGFILIPEFRAG